MMILYSSEASSMTWRRASREGVLLRMALRQAGSPSCEMTSRSSLAAMASYRAAGSSYSSGDVKWSWQGAKHRTGVRSCWPGERLHLPSAILPGHTPPYLVKLEGHANPRCHHSVKQVHISKDPLITWGGDAKVPLEQGMQAIEEGLQAEWGEDISNRESQKGLFPILPRKPISPSQSNEEQARLW